MNPAHLEHLNIVVEATMRRIIASVSRHTRQPAL
jgi:hypothetical protein